MGATAPAARATRERPGKQSRAVVGLRGTEFIGEERCSVGRIPWEGIHGGGDEAVALSMHRLYVPGGRRAVAERIPDLPDCLLDSIRSHRPRPAPQAVEQLVFGDDPSRLSGEASERFERLDAELYSLRIGPVQPTRLEIESEIAETNLSVRGAVSVSCHTGRA